MSSTKGATAWKTFITAKKVRIRGAEFSHRKKGAIGTFALFAEHESLAPFIEKLGNRQAAGAAIDAAAVRKAFDEVQTESGTGAGTLLLEIVQLLIRVVVDLVMDVAVIPDDERDDFRTFVESWDHQECMEFLASFLELNFPGSRGPFVRLVAMGRLRLVRGLDRLGIGSETEPSSEPGTSDASNTNGATDEAQPQAA